MSNKLKIINLVTQSAEELAEEFADSNIINELKDANLLISVYSIDGWEGNAFVLFEKEGILYEVNGSHCSCYGLEGQWEPSITTWKALAMRQFYGISPDYYDDLIRFIKSKA